MTRKKLLVLAFVFCFAVNLFLAKNIFAADAVKIKINDKVFDGINKNGEILIPVRDVFENLNLLVTFDDFYEPHVNIRNGFNGISINDEIFIDGKGVNLNIGQKEIYIDGQKKFLNQLPEIIDDKIFVGLELIGLTRDILGISYEKNNYGIVIKKKPGEFQIESEHYSEEKKNKSGKVWAKINYCKPIVEPRLNSAFVDKINKILDRDIQEFLKAVDENTEAYDGGFIKHNLPPLNYESAFDTPYNKNGLLCIVIENYYNNQGMHPDTERVSHIFDLKNNKELALSDILANGYENKIYDLFVDFVKKEYGQYGDETVQNILEAVSKEIQNVKFYLSDNSLKIYFDVYQVGAYAMGYPTIEIKYDLNKDLFKIAL